MTTGYETESNPYERRIGAQIERIFRGVSFQPFERYPGDDHYMRFRSGRVARQPARLMEHSAGDRWWVSLSIQEDKGSATSRMHHMYDYDLQNSVLEAHILSVPFTEATEGEIQAGLSFERAMEKVHGILKDHKEEKELGLHVAGPDEWENFTQAPEKFKPRRSLPFGWLNKWLRRGEYEEL